MSGRWKIAVGVVALVALAAAWIVWRWTRTPYGPMDLGAAIVIRAMPGGPIELTPEARARANSWTARFMGDGAEVGEIVETTFPGPAGERRARVYVPEGDGPFPLVYWIHGGGWWMGDELEYWDGAITPMVRDVPAVVVSPDYRLSPEHPFPAAVEDCWAGLLWSVGRAATWGADPTRLAVMGGSAGGNLAAVMAQRARDAGGPPIRLQVLVVPAVDFSSDATESERLFSDGYGLRGLDAMRAAYVPNEADRAHPWASPLLLPDFSGLPPALVVTAQFDPLRDEGEMYAERLRAAGVDARVHRFDGAIHGMLGSPGKMAQSQAMTIEALRGALGSR